MKFYRIAFKHYFFFSFSFIDFDSTIRQPSPLLTLSISFLFAVKFIIIFQLKLTLLIQFSHESKFSIFSSSATELISRRGVFSRRHYGSTDQVII